MTAQEFLEQAMEHTTNAVDRSVAMLWWAGRGDPRVGMTAKQIAAEFEHAGHSKQNASRLNAQLRRDRRTVKDGNGGWRLAPQPRRDLDGTLGALVPRPKPLANTDSVLPKDLFSKTRGYIERVVEQMNKSYDVGLYDCCAVMCRRLLETLIIEVYEHSGQSASVKAADGNFLMLSGLVSHLEADASLTLSRNGMKGVKDFKALGDLSAHNRRFNAQKSDIDRVRDGLRVVAEELLHLSGLRKS
jgi:hypothetical protein